MSGHPTDNLTDAAHISPPSIFNMMARNIRQCQGARPFFWQTCITLNPKEGVRLQHWKMGGVRWAIASQPGRVAKITWKRIRLVTGRQFVSFRERKIVLLIRVQSEVGKKNQQESRKAAAQFEDPSSELTDWNLVKLAPALSAVTLQQVSMSINVQFSKDFHGKWFRSKASQSVSYQHGLKLVWTVQCEYQRWAESRPNLVFWPSGNASPSGRPALSPVWRAITENIFSPLVVVHHFLDSCAPVHNHSASLLVADNLSLKAGNCCQEFW